ncbi:MAG: amidohydrolase family protein [Thermomicrobiales bacterium]
MTYLIRPEWLFASETGELLRNVAVTVVGTRIVAVETDRGVAEAGLTVIEAPGCTLLPGLIDAHVHLCMDANAPPLARATDPASVVLCGVTGAAATLRAGVTTVRCVGTPANVDLVLRDAIAQGRIAGPRIVAAGRPIAMTGGHAHAMAIEADGVDAVIAAVRSQIKAGVDVIKLMVTGGVLTPGGKPGTPQMLPEEIAVAITVAHRANRRVCGHAEGAEGVRDAILAGIDSIEHGFFVADDPLFAAMREGPTWLVPTLVAYAAILDARDALPPEAVVNAELAIERHRESFRHALAAEAPIAMGSDAGTPGNLHGANWREVAHMIGQGMSPAAALIAATRGGAALLGLADVGAIAPEMRADLLLVAGNPLAEVSSLGVVREVWSGGRRLPAAERTDA